ncbi:MAG TPA: fumarylacetoacetate hydrolase family protein [Smithella sp.]|nr:fumarylacetoacetate hydrolase family protein [Smithella sp.]
MKICRIISTKDEILSGIYDPSRPDEARIVNGAPFGELQVTKRKEKIKSFLPPVEPCAIFALGFNYGKHIAETGFKKPGTPVVFMKAPSCAIGQGEAILLPLAGPDKVDYEGELAIIIGKKGKNIPVSRAMDYIWGYTCANDVSARDWQLDPAMEQNGQFVRGKSFDTFCPLGPAAVTKDEIPHPNDLSLRTILNGQVVQESRTDNMVFDIPAIVSDLSRSLTLLPGTVILTGTPEGVGFIRQPPLFLKEGDKITVEIEAIGALTNMVKRERDTVTRERV